jgi:hypothetical protein
MTELKSDIKTVIAVLSLLHEPADIHSGTRKFRGRPVLEWTLKRLGQARSVDIVTVHCWDDQLTGVTKAVGTLPVGIVARGPRKPSRAMQAVTAARTWADGWRGGLLGSCDFDLGFHAGWVAELVHLHDADAAVLIDPAAALVDPQIVDAVVDQAMTDGTQELYFTQAPPGLAATLLRRELIDRLAVANVHPGRMLTYFPGQHGVDPVGKTGSVPVSAQIARTLDRFKVDSDRQLSRFDSAFAHLNGHLVETSAEGLVSARAGRQDDRLPRDVTLEITTRRHTNPVFSPKGPLRIDRPDLPLAEARKLFSDLARADDIRLTLGGVGDPLTRPDWADFVATARDAGIGSIHIETDFVAVTDDDLRRLIELRVDVLSVHHPAVNSVTYQKVMGTDHFSAALNNVTRLEQAVAAADSGTPLIAMTFTKIAANLGEMEDWYDYWIRRHGHAVIIGPSDFAGQMPALAIADMAPPRRRSCNRLSTQLTVLSDGKFVACTQDVTGIAQLGDGTAESAWKQIGNLRGCHDRGEYSAHPLCGSCKEWHRR